MFPTTFTYERPPRETTHRKYSKLFTELLHFIDDIKEMKTTFTATVVQYRFPFYVIGYVFLTMYAISISVVEKNTVV